MYSLLRPFLFSLPPEKAHQVALKYYKKIIANDFLNHQLEKLFLVKKSGLNTKIFDLNFSNPIGLAAGMDKNADYLSVWENIGFGFAEIGTVTPLPQDGNPAPRLFRLIQDRAIINRMGFNNKGVFYAKTQLEQWRTNHPNSKLIVGGNIGKNKLTDNDNAFKDYVICYTALKDVVDYIVINVSSPNTPGLRALQEKDALKKIVSAVQEENFQQHKPLPILLKIAPDLTPQQLDDIIELSCTVKLKGWIATNTTISRENLKMSATEIEQIGIGGLSGKPLLQKSTAILHHLYNYSNKDIPIIASGGIMSGADAKEKLNAGASAIQLWTGLIYEGPFLIKHIAQTLLT